MDSPKLQNFNSKRGQQLPPSLYQNLSIYIYLSIYLSISIYLYLFIFLSFYIYLYLSIFLSIYLSIYLYKYTYINVYICMYVYTYIYIWLGLATWRRSPSAVKMMASSPSIVYFTCHPKSTQRRMLTRRLILR